MTRDYSGVLLIGHGTREASGNAAFLEIVEHVRGLLPGMAVEAAFLEFTRPTIAEGIVRLAMEGATHIAVVPVFLSGLGHTMDDIPEAVAKAAGQHREGSKFRAKGAEMVLQRHENIRISLMSHLGAHERVVELSAVRYRQALEERKEIAAEETLLILAGHGSGEPEAILDLSEFAARRERLTPVGEVKACFAVLGKPQLSEVLRGPFKAAHKRVVVQPHLLLKGRFYDSICEMVEKSRLEHPEVDWVVTEPLGPDRLLAQAVVEIVRARGSQ